MTGAEYGVNATLEALQSAGVGTIGDTLFDTRAQVGNTIDGEGVYCISPLESQSTGGNNATWKTRLPIAIHTIVSSDNISTVYSADKKIREALMNLPYVDEYIPKVEIGSFQDLDIPESEMRSAIWQANLVVINKKEEN